MTLKQDCTKKRVEELFGIYLQRELNFCLRRFDFDTSLKWREQLLENKDKICDSIKRDLLRGGYHGFYRYK